MTDLDQLDDDHRRVVEALPADLFDLRDIEAARRRVATLRPTPTPRPDEVELRDRELRVDGATVAVRSYVARDRDEPGPAMLWIHGGGFVLGDLAMSDAACIDLVQTLGLTMVAVDYRLAPEFPHPAPLDDCDAALRWMVAGPHDLPIDPGRVAVGGVSAGAGLAAALALRSRDHGGPTVGYQLLTCPMLDDRTSPVLPASPVDHRFWNHDANHRAWRAHLPEGGDAPVDAHAAPARAEDLHGLPPAHVSVGDLDIFAAENIAYAEALRAAGSPVRLDVYAGAFHGSHAMVAHSPISQRWREAELEELRRWMGGERA